ncbi:aminoglycoside 6-adenylyltransferase [Gracilibacillus phocaeensis]|uniref:aminoglycoside 6-adenylyltransferase n=1 Tax=Gracilibacillus phocaeensis TaxID=2042304 RepID=UPI001031BC81|nr:aminoglycoside 6-adenylyltransferase [Gracilibacillus phocaeensis]
MRTEEEMMQLILQVAKDDQRIRAVGMNGSRTNPRVRADIFQDYDMVYVVEDMEAFVQDSSWVGAFGERIIMQTPEAMELFPPELGGMFSYLMLFTDGNRIDLTLCPVERAEEWHGGDRLAKVLLDKDHRLPSLPEPSDVNYWVNKPNQQLFDDCCNEFWWVSTYVVKGLWRREIIYAQDHLQIIREMLLQILSWRVGIETNFSLSVGKSGKHLEQLLTAQEWEQLMETYAAGNYQSAWRALDAMCSLFQQTAKYVATSLDFRYPTAMVERVRSYLDHIRQLPAAAKEIY